MEGTENDQSESVETALNDSAERIAKVIADMRKGNVAQMAEDIEAKTWQGWMNLFALPLPIIDATKLYRNFADGPASVRLYEDHVMCPPFDAALICYVNNHGNVHVTLMITVLDDDNITQRWESMDPDDHVIDWTQVKWVTTAVLWLGGRGNGDTESVQTGGPVHAWTLAINDDGTCQDLRWIHMMPKYPQSLWDGAMVTMFQTINYLNCVNVEVAEPHRSRHAQKRIQRYIGGTKVNEIRVRPVTKTRRGEHYDHNDFTMPFHTVRGHFARYGEEYGRKLLFGKYSGRFWIPGHARGSQEVGEREHVYIINNEGDEQ